MDVLAVGPRESIIDHLRSMKLNLASSPRTWVLYISCHHSCCEARHSLAAKSRNGGPFASSKMTMKNLFWRLCERFYSTTEPPPRVRTKPMQVLCVGLPRSGTESLQKALLRLGYDYTFHVSSSWSKQLVTIANVLDLCQLLRNLSQPKIWRAC